MPAKDRASLINKVHRVCKKKYTEETPPSGRNLLEHVVYACCLEDSTFEAADEAFAKLQADYYDWNEVRVTTVSELAEVCKVLAFPDEAATRIKKMLHGIFETYYSFDIDILRKENLGKTVEQFQKFKGGSPFVVSYLAQHGLGGHSIPLDRSLLDLFFMVGAITEAEREKAKVPGLERTIPKSKGIEFASLAHQLAAAFTKSQFNKDIRDIVLSISPSAQERFPKRGGRKKKVEPAPVKKPAAVKKETPPKEAAPKKTPAKKTTAKKEPVKKPTAKKTATKKAPAKKAPAKPAAKKAAAKKPAKKTPAKKTPASKTTTKKKSPTKRLARKKPR